MELKKPFLDPDLTLPELATETELPSYQLSRIINEKFGCNLLLHFVFSHQAPYPIKESANHKKALADNQGFTY